MSMAAGLGDQQHPGTAQQRKSQDSNNGKSIEAQSAAVIDTEPVWEAVEKIIPGIGADRKSMKEWNTKNLSQRLVVDAGCAATAGTMVAPVVSMIDKAIMENASGKQPLMTSIKNSIKTLLLRPHRYLTGKPFALILMVYGGTYLSANFLDTFKSVTRNRQASATSAGPAKFAATSAANLSLTMIKDSQFTKMFGTVSNRPVPPVTYALFALRDSMTIFASFNLPTMIAPRLPLSEAAEKMVSRTTAAQFLAPAAIQLISTPFHLYGLDLYNRNGGTPFSDRLNKVSIDWLKSSLARMCRIVPAFGFGGVVNNSLRKNFQMQLE